MRGEDQRSEGIFSYVRLEQRVPADHPLRAIRDLVDADPSRTTAADNWVKGVLAELDKARGNLRGMGGAGIPATQKWQDVRNAVELARRRGADREQGLLRTAAAIAASTQGLDLAKGGLTILIENTAGAEFSLGGSFEQVAEVLDRLRGVVPVAACIDTCHTHVAGYNIVSEEGLYQTLRHLDATIGLSRVKVWHCNDAKAARGSKLDRHEHVGRGTIGKETFRILLNDLRLSHAAFIAETPIDQPGDDRRNVDALKKLVS